MKIGMVFYDMQEFGGLEEYAVNLAIGLKEQGHEVSALSTDWVSPQNQYRRRLEEGGLRLIQPPKWISKPASDWETKERLLDTFTKLFSPLVWVLALIKTVGSRSPWKASLQSARNWVRGQLMNRIIGPDRRRAIFWLLFQSWRFSWRPDLLHLQGYTTNLLFVIEMAKKANIPVVYEEHQTPDAQFDWWQGFSQSVNKANRVIAVSEKSAEALQDVCGITQPIVVRNPLLADPVRAGWSRNGQAGAERNRIQITTVARLSEAKGLSYLLDAAHLVKQDYPNTSFRVYGQGELRDDLLEQAQNLNLDGPSIFAGSFTSREELGAIMAKTDIFVMPSLLEGQPLGVVEAMAYGCPIIATRVGGIPEIIIDGVNGLTCEPRDYECLAENITKLISNPDLRKRLGEAARSSYEQSPFQPESVSGHFISLYQEILQEERTI